MQGTTVGSGKSLNKGTQGREMGMPGYPLSSLPVSPCHPALARLFPLCCLTAGVITQCQAERASPHLKEGIL